MYVCKAGKGKARQRQCINSRKGKIRQGKKQRQVKEGKARKAKKRQRARQKAWQGKGHVCKAKVGQCKGKG